jgi:hypothetical protein
MNKLRKQSIIIGILIICSFIFGILSIEQSIDSDEYLSKVVENIFYVKLALVSQLLLAFTYIAIAVMIFDVIAKFDLGMSYGYLVFKSTAQVFNILGTIFIIAFITLSKEYGESSPDNFSVYVLMGELLKSARDYANHVIMILINNIGVLIFSFIAFRYKIIPRWMSLLGFFGAIVSGFASLLVLFELMDVLTMEYLLLNAPLAIQDLSLAIFLIFFGFIDNELGQDEKRKAGLTKA